MKRRSLTVNTVAVVAGDVIEVAFSAAAYVGDAYQSAMEFA